MNQQTVLKVRAIFRNPKVQLACLMTGSALLGAFISNNRKKETLFTMEDLKQIIVVDRLTQEYLRSIQLASYEGTENQNA